MLAHVLRRVHALADAAVRASRRRLGNALRPATTSSLVLGAATDLVRGKAELVAEDALLRQQLIILTRSVKRPRATRADRALLVLLASRVRAWRQALVIVQPATLLRRHRSGFRLFWRWRSTARSRQPRVAPDVVALIERMARENRLWGAERIRGELLKLGIAVGKRTIQRYVRGARPPRPAGQTWANFLRTHGREIWACDFLQLTDLFFRPIFAFFVVELGSRRVVHVGVTRSPTDAWVAQQLREATPEGAGPRFLVHDHDAKYGSAFARVAAASAIEVIGTPIRAPGPTPCASASWAAFGGSVLTTRWCSASGSSAGSWPSTSPSSTRRDRIRASGNARRPGMRRAARRAGHRCAADEQMEG